REGLDRAPVQTFEVNGSDFEIERRGDKVFHKEVFRVGGKEIGRLEAEVLYVLGSGSQGRSYLTSRAGRIYQSPISWYAGREESTAVADWFFPRFGWDLSPGYHETLQHFNRAITLDCLFCHSHRAAPVKDTINRYETEPFPKQSSIGCERCHGPGELHVRY